ncbi:unnamed protein product [Chrysoparadoxa australica]
MQLILYLALVLVLIGLGNATQEELLLNEGRLLFAAARASQLDAAPATGFMHDPPLYIRPPEFQASVLKLTEAVAVAPDSMPTNVELINALLWEHDAERLVDLTRMCVDLLLEYGLQDTAGYLAGNVALMGNLEGQASLDLYRLGLEVDPSDGTKARKLAEQLTRHGNIEEGKAVYHKYLDEFGRDEGEQLTGEQKGMLPALRLQAAAAFPSTLDTWEEAEKWHRSLVQDLADVVENNSGESFDPHFDLGLSATHGRPAQYTGFSNLAPRMLLTQAILGMTPALKAAPPDLSPQTGWEESRKRHLEREGWVGKATAPTSRHVKVGILLERFNVHSPTLVLSNVWKQLDRTQLELVAFAQRSTYSDVAQAIIDHSDKVVWLPDRPGCKSVTSEVDFFPSTNHTQRSVDAGMPDFWGSRWVIEQEEVDAIIFIGLGSMLFLDLLSLGRAAPVQICFGLGHPMTSGSSSVDYFVSSQLLETSTSTEARMEAHMHPMDLVVDHDKELRRGDGVQDYTEQVVMMDTYSGSFAWPDVPDPELSEQLLREYGWWNSGMHLYHCLQAHDKMHHSFDAVMRGVLENDDRGLILLKAESRRLLPRLEKSIGPELLERVVFLDAMGRDNFLALTAATAVFLAPFGWGAGITSFEALALCVPVVASPAHQSVLQFTQGQLLQLGMEELLADTVEEYVSTAVSIGRNETRRAELSETICSRRHMLLDLGPSVAAEWTGFLKRAVRAATS